MSFTALQNDVQLGMPSTSHIRRLVASRFTVCAASEHSCIMLGVQRLHALATGWCGGVMTYSTAPPTHVHIGTCHLWLWMGTMQVTQMTDVPPLLFLI